MQTTLYPQTQQKIVAQLANIMEIRNKNSKDGNMYEKLFGEEQAVQKLAEAYEMYNQHSGVDTADLVFCLRVMYEYLVPIRLSKVITNEIFDNNPQLHIIQLVLATRKKQA
ncbi:hypothetical protein QQ054_32050 [Oscillatoria amoena NRMC-F 0135]|nr:hypothetical protein [Oscillatoria amoena NRMC-F 0135]